MLTRLRCLNLEYTPSGMISSLQELQVLQLYGSKLCRFFEDCVGDVENNDDGDASKDSHMSRREKSLLDELECLAGGLKGLGIYLHSADSFRRLSMLSRAVSIWRLKLDEVQDSTVLHLQHNIWRSLQQLSLSCCIDVEVLEFVVDAE